MRTGLLTTFLPGSIVRVKKRLNIGKVVFKKGVIDSAGNIVNSFHNMATPMIVKAIFCQKQMVP